MPTGPAMTRVKSRTRSPASGRPGGGASLRQVAGVARAARDEVEQRALRQRAALRVLGPRRRRADRRGAPAGRHDVALEVLGAARAGARDRLGGVGGLAEHGEQRRAVPRVVRVQAHPAVEGRDEARELGKAGLVGHVGAQVALAGEGQRRPAGVEARARRAAAAGALQLGGGDERAADRRHGERVAVQPRPEQRRRLADPQRVRGLGRATERGPGLGEHLAARAERSRIHRDRD